MSKELTFKEYKDLVEAQAQEMLDALATAATGNMDFTMKIPEGIDILTELAYGFTFLIEDLKALLDEQETLRADLEDRVAARTVELEKALEESKLSQKRYLSQEWASYINEQKDNIDSNIEFDDELVPLIDQLVEANQTQMVERSPIDQTGSASLAVPVRYADETIGVFGFSADEVGTWDEGDIAAVEDIVEQVGLALENQRLFDQTQIALAETEEQARRLARLNEMGAELNTAIDIQDVYTIATNYVRELLRTDLVSVTILSDDFQYFHVYATQGIEGVSRTGDTWGLEDTVIGEAVYQRNVLYHPDITQTDFADHKRLIERGAKSTIVAPLVAQKVIGTLNAASKKLNGFSSQEENLLLQIASLLAATIENRELLDQTAQRAAQLGRLSRIESALSLAENSDDIIKALAEGFPEFPGYIRLYYIDTDENEAPKTFTTMSLWRKQDQDGDALKIGASRPVNQDAPWIKNPSSVIWVEDVTNDDRFSDRLRHERINRKVISSAGLPLRSAGRWQAFVSFGHSEPFVFNNDYRFVLENLLDTLSAVVANQRSAEAQERAYQESVRRSRELDALNQVGRVVVQQLDERQLSDAIFEQIQQVLDFDIFFVGIYNQPTNEFNTLMFSDKTQRLYNLPPRKLTPKNGTFQAISQRDTILVQPTLEEFAELPAPDPSQLIGQRTTIAPSRVYVPLTSGRNVIGSLSIHSNKFQAYSQNEVNLLNGIATYFAVAWQNANLFQETNRRAEDLATINKIAEEISGQLDEDQIYQSVFARLQETLDFDVAMFGLYDKHTNILDFRYQYFDKRLPGTSMELTPNTFSYDVIKEVKPQLIQLSDEYLDNLTEENLPDNVIDKKMKTDQPTSMLFVPLVSGSEAIGIMSIQTRKRKYYNQESVNLLTGVASYVSVAIQNSQLFAQTQRRADRERLVNEITQKIQGTTSIEKALQTTVQELGRALKSHYAQISLATPEQTAGNDSTGAS